MEKINSSAYAGITDAEFAELQQIFAVQERTYKKGAYIFRMRDLTRELGIVVEGSVLIENNDLWGNTSILTKIGPGGVFAETYALCARPMMVDVIAVEDCRIQFLDLSIVTNVRYAQASWYGRMIRNFLEASTEKNLILSARISCTTSKSVRGRILAYLSQQSVRAGSSTFTIPFNRQQMADYLNVDRSALSKELGRMQEDGLIIFKKNKFTILQQPGE